MARLRWVGLGVGAVLLPGLPLSCNEEPKPHPLVEAGVDGSGFGVVRDASSDGSTLTCGDAACPALTCGDAACPAPPPSRAGTRACCQDGGGCGLVADVGGDTCRAPGRPGSLDLGCPESVLRSGRVLAGCCTEEGRCGASDPTGGLGCIPTASEGDAPGCHFAPGAECTSLALLPCDGPEDCEPGLECCGRVQEGLFDRFVCHDSCRELLTGASGTWLELCHGDDDCGASGTCVPDPALPSFLLRCRAGRTPPLPEAGPDGAFSDASRDASDATTPGDGPGAPDGDATSDVSQGRPDGSSPAPYRGVACGARACSDGERCCLRPPSEPFCSSSGEACSCALGE